MVVDSSLSSSAADRIFHALADATRRDIVLLVLRDEQSVSSLARHYPISLTAVQKHVEVLVAAGLVTKRRHGREQVVRAEIDTVRRAAQLLDRYEEIWRDRIDRMGELLIEPEPEPDPRNGA